MTAQKIAVVTCASRGIGRAIAKRLAKDGLHVIAHFGASQKQAESLANEIRLEGGQISLVQAGLGTINKCSLCCDCRQKICKTNLGIWRAWLKSRVLSYNGTVFGAL